MKTCIFGHKWSEWGPPYEAYTKYTGSRHTFQQRKCERCGKHTQRKIAGFGHTVAQVPLPDGKHLAPPPATTATVLAPVDPAEEQAGREKLKADLGGGTSNGGQRPSHPRDRGDYIDI